MVAIQFKHKHTDFTIAAEGFLPQAPIPTLHALLIGIDTYRNHPHLSGAVNDMESVNCFLRSDLSVPESQITKLKNGQATRSSIINAMQRLSQDDSIERSQPILIYYAGHGCEIDSPLVDYKGKAQCLVPWDAGDSGADGQPIPAIPDYTISVLLNELATKKGNNITVIFDSCHSASGTRGIWGTTAKADPTSNDRFPHQQGAASCRHVNDPGGDCRSRSIDPHDLPPLTLETDKDIIGRAQSRRRWRIIVISVFSHLHFTHMAASGINETRAKVTSVQPSNPFGSSRSHVLLAACGHAEIAHECKMCNCGYFTAALLQVLRSRRLGKLKYKRCFEQFPKLNTPGPQNPVCEGDATGREFFAIPTPIMAERSASFTMEQRSCEYFMKLGDAQGVFPGSRYGIYEDNTIPIASTYLPSPGVDRPLCGTFIAHPCGSDLEPALYPLHSWCELEKEAILPNQPRAMLLELGCRGSFSLRVYFTKALEGILDPNSVVQPNQGMALVDTIDSNTVVLDVDHGYSGRIIFRYTLAGFPGILYECYPSAERVHGILHSMAQWYWHRFREPMDTHSTGITARITMYELGKGEPRPLPVEMDSSVCVKVSPTTLYGLKVESLFPGPLYAYLFYFSTARQSIRPLYLGMHGSLHIDAPLEPCGQLTFGYNNDDMIPGPFSFSLPQDEGCFRLFLTTLPGDFDSMFQPSPFIELPTCHATPINNLDGFGDGLEIQTYYSPSWNEVEPSVSPASPSGEFSGHSTEIIVAEVIDVSVSEPQQPDTASRSEYFPRKMLSATESTKRIISDLGAPPAKWEVVNLKVKCGGADGQ